MNTSVGFRFVFYRKNVHGHVHVITKIDQEIISAIKEKSSIKIKELALVCKRSEKTVSRSLSKLKELGKIERKGSDKLGIWVVKEK